jgi:hypothetical protein
VLKEDRVCVSHSQEARSARQREDRQVEQLLRVFGSDKAMLFGSVALMLGSLAFGYAWRSGALERDSPSAAMARSEEATEYMLKNGGLPTQEELEGKQCEVAVIMRGRKRGKVSSLFFVCRCRRYRDVRGRVRRPHCGLLSVYALCRLGLL